MGRELQKKKARSGRQPVRQPNRPKNPLNPLGNSTIAQNWDKTQTLAQNYRRLGLTARLRAPAGGTETLLRTGKDAKTSNPKNKFAISSTPKAIMSEAKVERDADGKIIRVISTTATHNPLNDPLAAFDSDNENSDNEDVDMQEGGKGKKDRSHEHEAYEEWGGIVEKGDETDLVRTLMEEARNPAEKKPRYQSSREKEWLGDLVAKHGDDYQAMARDRKLNPMQQTAADLGRRIKKLNKA